MEHFYLEEPSINRKEDVIAYMQEHVNYNSFINGSGGFDHILGGKTFEDCLEKSINMQSKDYAYGNGMVPGKEFFLIREEDNKLVGMINIRYDLNEAMLEFGGHIGYGIRPTERRKGYNKINLYLGLIEAKKLGLEDVMLDCDVKNLGSDKTIQRLGGVLEGQGVDPEDGTLTNVYWINIDKSIEKYKDIYDPFIYKRTK